MRTAVYILAFFITFSCFALDQDSFSKIAKEVKDKAVHEIEQKYSGLEVLEKEPRKPINRAEAAQALPLYIGFHDLMDIPTARKKIIEWATIYVRIINDSSAMQQYLSQSPATLNSVEITAILFNEKMHVPPQGALWSFSLRDGLIQYYTLDRNMGNRTVCQESTEDAQTLLTGGKKPEGKPEAKPWEPPQGTEYASLLQQMAISLQTEIRKAEQTKLPSLVLCKAEESFFPQAALNLMKKEERQLIDVVAFTPIPFISSTLCHKAKNCLIGLNGYFPLLDMDRALDYIREGVTLGQNSLPVVRFEWSVDAPMYQAVLMAELSKKQDEVTKAP